MTNKFEAMRKDAKKEVKKEIKEKAEIEKI